MRKVTHSIAPQGFQGLFFKIPDPTTTPPFLQLYAYYSTRLLASRALVQNMTTPEIAETLQISQQAVSDRLVRARTKLRKALGKEFEGDD